MQVSLDLGIPGLVAWLSIFLSIIFISWQVYMTGWKMNDYLFTAMGAALISCQISLIVHGLMDSVTWGMVRPAPLVWIIWGIGAAFFSKINKLQVKT
jgi:putative inorganic carbon (HCO3(-)) transporter